MQTFVTKTFSVSGMTCIHCQNTIEKALQATKGIKSAKVRFSTSLATVVFDSNAISFKEIGNMGIRIPYNLPVRLIKKGINTTLCLTGLDKHRVAAISK